MFADSIQGSDIIQLEDREIEKKREIITEIERKSKKFQKRWQWFSVLLSKMEVMMEGVMEQIGFRFGLI